MRNPFSRSAGIPDAVAARARLVKGERVLASTVSRDGAWLVGTRDALVLVPPASAGAGSSVEPAGTRIPWEGVERADWDREGSRLRIVEVGEFGRPRPEHTYAVDEPGQFLPLVRERVTARVVLQRRVVVSGKKGLFVIARRPPRGTGDITWAYEFDRDVDPADPAVMEVARRGLLAAAEELGL